MPFKPGESGNPAGRPKGIKSKRSLIAEMIDDVNESQIAKIIKNVFDGAESGDQYCVGLIWNTYIPKAKGRLHRLPELVVNMNDDEGVKRANSVLLAAVGEGRLTAEEAKECSAVIEGQRKMIETIDIRSKLDAIDARMTQAGIEKK